MMSWSGVAFLLTKDHREHVNPNKHKWKSAYWSSPNPDLSLFSPPVLTFPGLRHASFWHDWLLFPTDGPDVFWRPRTEFALRQADLCASWPRGGGSWESYNLWESHLFLRMPSTFKPSSSPAVTCLLLLCPANVLKSKQKISGKKYEVWESTSSQRVTF